MANTAVLLMSVLILAAAANSGAESLFILFTLACVVFLAVTLLPPFGATLVVGAIALLMLISLVSQPAHGS